MYKVLHLPTAEYIKHPGKTTECVYETSYAAERAISQLVQIVSKFDDCGLLEDSLDEIPKPSRLLQVVMPFKGALACHFEVIRVL